MMISFTRASSYSEAPRSLMEQPRCSGQPSKNISVFTSSAETKPSWRMSMSSSQLRTSGRTVCTTWRTTGTMTSRQDRDRDSL
ncbi:hypothetical protein EYF80_016191 [Liparis tanakae]|uniref:Uncharacterized protein n=1 Tax=Liparis tanakae TaxID=230148 RepID=A0A4Z2I6D1_9TELE|nr:hypothetical protein EYF80_016191 [Liparis tanakae]